MAQHHPSSSPCSRNAELIAAYQRSGSIHDRNALIHANLPLVWRVARQEAQRSGHSFEDLCQEGCLGLIRAVERFEPQRGHTLSTAAVPWIRGAIRHYLRDRSALISGSHHLLELHRQGQALQQQRLQQGLAPCSEQELIGMLGCTAHRWHNAVARQRSLQLASLDQPQQEPQAEASSLVEQLADTKQRDAYADAIRWEQRRLLWRCLRLLKRQQRRLVLGRLLGQRSWRELGEQCGLTSQAARRHGQQLLEELQQQLRPAL